MLTNTTSAVTDSSAPTADIRSLLPFLLSLFCRSAPSTETARRAEEHAGSAAYELIEHTGANRSVAEKFIAQCFGERFGARVDTFMPRLLTLRNREGATCGALGLRAASSKLFIEQYLSRPIEDAISARTGAAVDRRSIVEVGHFSGSFPGAMRAMIVLLTDRLHREGFEWVAFAGTRGLRNAFVRMGMFPIGIRAAEIESIPPGARAAWGSYYDHEPWVYVGRVAVGVRTLVDGTRAALADAESA